MGPEQKNDLDISFIIPLILTGAKKVQNLSSPVRLSIPVSSRIRDISRHCFEAEQRGPA